MYCIPTSSYLLSWHGCHNNYFAHISEDFCLTYFNATTKQLNNRYIFKILCLYHLKLKYNNFTFKNFLQILEIVFRVVIYEIIFLNL